MPEVTKPIAPPAPNAPTPQEMENLVINWFQTGQSIEWIPLISAEDVPEHVTQYLVSLRDQHGPWILHTPMDLHTLAEGLTGWLLPSGQDDTYVVCGYWDGEVEFMLMTHRDTGEVVTYRTSGHGKGYVHEVPQYPTTSSPNCANPPLIDGRIAINDLASDPNRAFIGTLNSLINPLKESLMTTTHQVHVTDTNNRSRGVMPIDIEFDEIGPCVLMHDGQRYCFTYKSGVNPESGVAVREMATPTDARLWITVDATHIWED